MWSREDEVLVADLGDWAYPNRMGEVSRIALDGRHSVKECRHKYEDLKGLPRSSPQEPELKNTNLKKGLNEKIIDSLNDVSSSRSFRESIREFLNRTISPEQFLKIVKTSGLIHLLGDIYDSLSEGRKMDLVVAIKRERLELLKKEQQEANQTGPKQGASSSPPVSSSVQTHQSSSGLNSGKEEDKYNRGSDGTKPDFGSRFSKAGRTGPIFSNDVASGPGNAASGGSSARGPPASATRNELSPEEAYCRRHEITVSGGQVPPPLMSFEAAGLPRELMRKVCSAGFSAPSPIQAQSWPIAMQNRDIVAIAKTGYGKTLGYLIPGLMHLLGSQNNPRMGPTILVLSPTRELATQIQVEALKLSNSSRILCACFYGGSPKGPQLKEIERGVEIVVATPEGLNAIIEMRRISLRQVSYLVLDDADTMLDMGFEPQIRKIVGELPTKSKRQTLMYTATWPKEVRKFSAELLLNPAQVNIGNVDE